MLINGGLVIVHMKYTPVALLYEAVLFSLILQKTLFQKFIARMRI